MYVCMYVCQLTCSISKAVKCIRSIRRWAYEVFGNEHAIEVRCAAVLYLHGPDRIICFSHRLEV